MRYQDRSHLVPLRSLSFDQEALVQGQVVNSEIAFGKRRSLLITIEDDTGQLVLRYFYFSKTQQQGFAVGRYVRAYGVARFGPKRLEMVHPEYSTSESPPPEPQAALTPIYPTTDGLGQTRLRKLAQQALALDFVGSQEGEETSGWPLAELAYLHQPPADASAADIEQMQQRIAFDELTAYYLVMQHRQSQRQQQQTLALPPANQLGRELLRQLGFRLTDAQRRATTEVLNDLARTQPMLRLIQGDVGSGKTVVAAFAAIRAAEHGAQTALMAPTEILAEQHYLNFSAWLAPLGIEVVLLTGSQKAKERRAGQEAIASGQALVAVGTHALFQQSIAFHNLGLTIVDEQHRFGVHQRMSLRDKGQVPHQLVLTATPIPRTLTMALYADMDVSLIDELPAGRQPITTVLVNNNRRDEILTRVRAVMDEGQQVYWVCTLIEPADELTASAAEPTYAELQQALPNYRIGLLHGRMNGAEKAHTMQAFKAGELQLLVATTVIEVGVDAPNATLIIIEDPNRLGLA
nr:ATP-dependent DNA helicase RecG [Gammaproteobacteria bacterium]